MNTLQHAWQRARRRRALITLLLGLPWALAAAVLDVMAVEAPLLFGDLRAEQRR